MSKYAAKISIGWLEKVFEADTVRGIIDEAAKVQDFDCLLRMAQFEEEDEEQLSKFESFLDKYHYGRLTVKDIQNLDIELSIGDIKCLGFARTQKEISELKSK